MSSVNLISLLNRKQINNKYQGLRWNSSLDVYTRLGSISSVPISQSAGNINLPIQSQMLRCMVLDNETINYFVSSSDPLMKAGSTVSISGITTSTSTYNLVNSSVNFITQGVVTGNVVRNSTNNKYAVINGVSANTLSLSLDIITSGNTYQIGNARYDGSDGQVMTQIPKFYYKQYINGFDNYWYISKYPLNDFTLHPAFIRDNVVVSYRYMGSFEGSMYVASTSGMTTIANIPVTSYVSGNELCSIAGTWPKTSESRMSFRSMATSRGTNWRQMDYYLLSAVQLLYLIEYANFNSQSMIGAGRTNISVTSWIPNDGIGITGLSIINNNGSGGVALGGTAGDMKDYMTYRGIENFYGNVWKFIDGITWDSSLNDSTSRIPVWVSGNKAYFNDNASTNMKLLVNATNIGVTNAGYVSNLENCVGFIPSAVGASSTSKITDYYYQYSTNGGGWRVPLFGGVSSDGAAAGSFYLASVFGWAYVGVGISARGKMVRNLCRTKGR